MGNKEKTLDIKTVGECNRCLGCKTLHPQASLINLGKKGLDSEKVKFEFYAILLIEDNPDGCCCCGRKYYDYAFATMVFLTPGEIFRMDREHTLPEKGWLLAFHPDLLTHTPLCSYIGNYTFFGYKKEEALHLSQHETGIITCCMEHIENELHHPIDRHTGTLLSRLIELLLDYSKRFYERQFITRENKNKALLQRAQRLLDEYIESGRLQGGKSPTADYCGEKLGLSAAYFTDLLLLETGMTLDEYFRLRMVEAAKHMLLNSEATPAAVARQLGIPSVQRFSRLFKTLTGLAPGEYSQACN